MAGKQPAEAGNHEAVTELTAAVEQLAQEVRVLRQAIDERWSEKSNAIEGLKLV